MDRNLLDIIYYASPVFDSYKNSFLDTKKREPDIAFQRNMAIVELLNSQHGKNLPSLIIVFCKFYTFRPLHYNQQNER